MLSVDNKLLVERDPEIPALGLILDNEEIGGLLREYFRDQQIGDVRCDYFRYKPRTNCLSRISVETHSGVHVFHAVAHRHDAIDKLKKAESRAAESLALEKGWSVSPIVVRHQCLVIYPFPLDHEVPSLSHLSTRQSLVQLLTRLAPDLDVSSDVGVQQLRYKPQRRYVGRIDVNHDPYAVLRIYSNSEYLRARRAAKTLSSGNLPVEPCAGHSDRQKAMLFRWLPGQDVQALASCGIIPCAAIEKAGRDLASFHQLKLNKLPANNESIYTRQLQEATDGLLWLLPELIADLQGFSARLSKTLRNVEVGPSSPVHGDFGPSQIVVDGETARFLDFDNAAIGLPAEDLGSFLAHLEERVSLGHLTASARDDVFGALVKGYSESSRTIDHLLVTWFASTHLLRMAQEPFRHGLPDWRAAAGRIVERAASLFENVSSATTRSTSSKSASGQRRAESRTIVEDPFGVEGDEGMPFLKDAITPNLAANMLCPLINQDDPSAVKLVAITVLRLKPNRRCLIRYDAHRCDTNTDIQLLGKVHTKRRHDKSFHHQQALWDAGFTHDALDGICAAQPIGVVPQWHMWLQEFVSGETSWNALAGPSPATTARRIAEAANKLHAANIISASSHTISDELNVLDNGLQRLARTMPRLSKRLMNLYDRCASIAGEISIVQPVGIHRDFHPDQVLIDRQRLYVVDHDLYCLGDPCLDIGNFCGHLVELGIRVWDHPSALDTARHALVDHFLELNTEASRQSIEIYTILTLARHVFLSTRYAERKRKTKEILAYCERTVSAKRCSESGPIRPIQNVCETGNVASKLRSGGREPT